jgi:hypothetical protein
MAKRTSVNLPPESKKALFMRAVQLEENLQDLTGPAAEFFAKVPGDSLAEVLSNAEWAIQLIGDAVEESKKSHRRDDHRRGDG